MARNRLPSSEQIHIRHGPSNGLCVICGEVEDADHIFFNCVLAKFSWSVFREVLGVQWNPLTFSHFSAIIEGLGSPSKRLAWLLFCAMSWAMWTTRNKFTIEAKFPRHPADGIYKCLLFLQLWRPLQSISTCGSWTESRRSSSLFTLRFKMLHHPPKLAF